MSFFFYKTYWHVISNCNMTCSIKNPILLVVFELERRLKRVNLRGKCEKNEMVWIMYIKSEFTRKIY